MCIEGGTSVDLVQTAPVAKVIVPGVAGDGREVLAVGQGVVACGGASGVAHVFAWRLAGAVDEKVVFGAWQEAVDGAAAYVVEGVDRAGAQGEVLGTVLDQHGVVGLCPADDH